MPGTSKSRNPQGWEIVFDEESHTYTTKMRGNHPITTNGSVLKCAERLTDDGDDTVLTITYTSGTKFVHHFFPQFDADGKIAAKKARDRGTSVEQIRFEWAQHAAEACAMGTRVHETCEDVLKGRRDLLGNYEFRNKPQSDHEDRLMRAGIRAAEFVKGKFEVLGIEQIVFDLDIQLAGTIDLLVRDRSDGTVWILDWKTNNKIEFRNNYRTNNRALFPISHLDNCSAVQYGLQLSTYQFLMVRAGYFPREQKFRRAIFHLTEDGPVFHELPDYSIEVRDMAIAMALEPPF